MRARVFDCGIAAFATGQSDHVRMLRFLRHARSGIRQRQDCPRRRGGRPGLRSRVRLRRGDLRNAADLQPRAVSLRSAHAPAAPVRRAHLPRRAVRRRDAARLDRTNHRRGRRPPRGLHPRAADAGIRISLVEMLRNHPKSVNPLIKSNNLLNNALAMQAAYRSGAEEGLMCNYRGELTECSQANFFMVRGGAALTPKSEAGLLEGVTRAFLFEIGREIGVEVREDTLYPK